LWDQESNKVITEEMEIRSEDLNMDEWTWLVPPIHNKTKADVLVEISLNQ
jgi:hypothetical protein